MNRAVAQTPDHVEFQADLPIKILILDDDSFDRKRLRRWFELAEPRGVHLSEAVCLGSFSERLDAETFDLVLVDFALSDGTGLDAMQKLRTCTRNVGAYSVMISGREDQGLRDTSLMQGCDAFITKSDLSLSRIHSLITATRKKALPEPQLPSRRDGQSALDFWSSRAALRNHRDQEQGRDENHIVISNVLGTEIASRAILRAPTEVEAVAATLDTDMSAKLKSFISEFLAPEKDFEFEEMKTVGEDAEDDARKGDETRH